VSQRDSAFVHLLTELTHYARENQSGTVLPRTLVYIEEKEVAVIPDIVFVKRARSGIIQKNRIFGVPDLVVEIVSNPSHRDKLLGKRKRHMPDVRFLNIGSRIQLKKRLGSICWLAGHIRKRKNRGCFPICRFSCLIVKRVEGCTGMK